jgi:hypothetical protein
MRGRNLVRQMCPKNCAGRDGHVHRVGKAEEVRMPQEIWNKYKDDPAYHCSYCDAVWFKGRLAFAVVVGLYSGMEFREFSEPQTVYMEKQEKTLGLP